MNTHGDGILHENTQYGIDSLNPGAEIEQARLAGHQSHENAADCTEHRNMVACRRRTQQNKHGLQQTPTASIIRKITYPTQSHLGRAHHYPPCRRMNSPAVCASCTMSNMETLWKHYRSVREHYGSITEHYGSVTEPLQNVAECYGTL